jgi:hypothetical protein
LVKDKELVSTYGANHAKALRCVKPWFGSDRCVILDSGFASYKCIRGMAENGMYVIGNVKYAHVAFPKVWLKQNAHVRGERSCDSTSFKTAVGETWSVLGACGIK